MAAPAGMAVKLALVAWAALAELELEPPRMEPAAPQGPRFQWRTGTVERAAQDGIRILPGARVEMVAPGATGARLATAETEEWEGLAVPGLLAPTATRWAQRSWVEMALRVAWGGSVETVGRVGRCLAIRVRGVLEELAGRAGRGEVVLVDWMRPLRGAAVRQGSLVGMVLPVVPEALEAHQALFLERAVRASLAMEGEAETAGQLAEEGTAAMEPMAMFQLRMAGMVGQVETAVREAQVVWVGPQEALAPMRVWMDLIGDPVMGDTEGTVETGIVPERPEKPSGTAVRAVRVETTATVALAGTVETTLAIPAVLPRSQAGQAGWAARESFRGGMEARVDRLPDPVPKIM
jgi:hypothetical protein